MTKKSLFFFILLLLFLSGNIYFACRYFASARTEFQVEGDKNDFLCRWGSGTFPGIGTPDAHIENLS